MLSYPTIYILTFLFFLGTKWCWQQFSLVCGFDFRWVPGAGADDSHNDWDEVSSFKASPTLVGAWVADGK